MSARLTVEGIADLDEALKGLPDDVRRSILADAIRSAGEMVRSAIAGRATFGRYSTGKLRDSIVFRETQIGGEPSGVIVPNRKKGGGGRHAHLVEFPTSSHGGHPGTRGQPFFEPAVDSTQDAAMDLMERAVSDRIGAYWDSQGGAE